MPCYPLHFGASIHNALHHRSCLKTCIKLKQQKALLPFNLALPFSESLFTENCGADTVTSSVAAQLRGSQNPAQGEVQEGSWRRFHPWCVRGSLLVHVLHAECGKRGPRLSKTKRSLSRKVSRSL